MSTKPCKHDYREAYDEHENAKWLGASSANTIEGLRAMLYHRTLRAIYCRKCGDQLPIAEKTP